MGLLYVLQLRFTANYDHTWIEEYCETNILSEYLRWFIGIDHIMIHLPSFKVSSFVLGEGDWVARLPANPLVFWGLIR